MIDVTAGLEWTSFDIPGGNSPVAMALLDHDPATRARTVLVRFPEAWKRLETGSYVAAEELLLLDGTLAMNGAVWRSGDWAYVPAHALREEMFSDDGALAFARFLGPAKWLPREGERIEFEHRALADVRAGEPVASTLGARVWELRAGTSWLVDEIAAGSPAENDTEVFALRGLLYDRLGRGEPLPRIDGPSFCRIDGGGQ